MSSVEKTLPKPVLRGFLARSTKKHMIIAFTLSVLAGITFKYTVAEPRKKRYADFYKDYDPLVDLERMKELGLLQSAAPGDPLE